MNAFGWAWLFSVATLALHVADEASHDFLAWYNPQALRIRHALRVLPFPPTFTFWPWLLGLSAAVVGLALLTPAAFRGAAWMPDVARVIAIIHLFNGLLHLAGAARSRRAVPGVLSAPMLLVAGAWLWYAADKVH